jgi:hypothetical protein
MMGYWFMLNLIFLEGGKEIMKAEITPLTNSKNTQLAVRIQSTTRHSRIYTHSSEIVDLCMDKFKKTAKGITYKDLITSGIVYHKKQAQDTLKYHRIKGVLFTVTDSRPQHYYPVCKKSEVIETLSKNTQIDHTGVTISKHPLSNSLEKVIIQTLEGYVLPLLPAAPLYIHNLHFKLKITPECYVELDLQKIPRNNRKQHSEILGSNLVTYTFYPGGTINVTAESSINPYKLESEIDRSRLLIFFGQLRDRLITFLTDKHERIVPDIMEWELSECDINKDIKVSDALHAAGFKIQVKHLDHVFRIYIKSMGKDTVCRVEENKQPKKPPIEAIDNIFNPYERIQKQIAEIQRMLNPRSH